MSTVIPLIASDPVLGFQECSNDTFSATGRILVGQTINFAPALVEPFWALGFEFMGRSFPNSANAQQAFFYTSLQLLNCSEVNSTTAQCSDSYMTPSGLVQTQFQVVFNHASQQITLTNLMTKLPQNSTFLPCTEILVNFWRAVLFNYAEASQEILLPFLS